MTKRGRAWYGFKDRIIDAIECFNFSEYFKWTPEQTRALDKSDKRMYLAFMKGISKAKPKKNG